MQVDSKHRSLSAILFAALIAATSLTASSQSKSTQAQSRLAPDTEVQPRSTEYQQVQQRLAHGWNTWDVRSVTTHVLIPEGLAIHVGLKHNSSLNGEAFLGDALIGRLSPGAEQVTPGPHSWDGSYTDLKISWHNHNWRVQSAHDGNDHVVLVFDPRDSHGAIDDVIYRERRALPDRRRTNADAGYERFESRARTQRPAVQSIGGRTVKLREGNINLRSAVCLG